MEAISIYGIDNSYFYTLNHGNKSYIYMFRFVLKENINVDVLKKALKETIKCFQRFRLKPILCDNNKIKLVENEADLPIYEYDGNTVYLGTKDSNGYMYRVLYKNKNLYISIFHMLSDGGGFAKFYETLFYNYYKMMGRNVEIGQNVCMVENIKKDNYNETIYDIKTIELEKNKNLKFIQKFVGNDIKKEKYVLELKNSIFAEKKFYHGYIQWDSNKMLDVAHKYNSTITEFMIMLISQSIIELNNVKNKKLSYVMAVDLRKYFESKSVNNFSLWTVINYDTDWYRETKEEQLKKIHNDISDNTQKDYMNFLVNAMKNAIEKEYTEEDIKEELIKSEGEIYLSNVGYKKFVGGIQENIEDMMLYATPTKNDYEIQMQSFNNIGRLIVCCNSKEEKILNELKNKIKSYNIECEYSEMKKVETDHLDIMLFDKE